MVSVQIWGYQMLIVLINMLLVMQFWVQSRLVRLAESALQEKVSCPDVA